MSHTLPLLELSISRQPLEKSFPQSARPILQKAFFKHALVQMKYRLQIHTHRAVIRVCLHDIRHIIPPFPAMKSLFFKKDAWKIFFSFPHVLQFLYFLFVFLSQANSAIISATCSIFSHRHAFSPQNSSASSVSPLAACTSALVIQYGVSAGLQVAIH